MRREPSLEQHVVGERLEERRVDAVDVRRVARERRPPERAGAAAEERPDVRGDEPREVERVLEAGVACLGAQVVAVVEDMAARAPEVEHRLDVPNGRLPRPAHVLVGVGLAQRERVGELDPRRYIPVQHVVRGRLVGHEVEVRAAAGDLGEDVGGFPRMPTETPRPSAAYRRTRSIASSRSSATSSR